MSDRLKWELAQELGVADIVAHEGWGGVSARNCGNLVKLAIARAEEAMARDYAQAGRVSGRREAGPAPENYTRWDLRASPGEFGETRAVSEPVYGGAGQPFPYWAVEPRPGQPELRPT